MGKTDARVELRIAGEASLKTGHANQNQANPGSVVVVAQFVEAVGREPISFIHDDEFAIGIGTVRAVNGKDPLDRELCGPTVPDIGALFREDLECAAPFKKSI